MKYIVVKNKTGLVQCLVFSENITHFVAASSLRSEGYKPVSAGFCYFERGRFRTVLGRTSVSLKLEPQVQDEYVLNKMLNNSCLSEFLDFSNELYNAVE